VHINKYHAPDGSQIIICVGVQQKNNKNNCIEASSANMVEESVFEYCFGEKYSKYFFPMLDNKKE